MRNGVHFDRQRAGLCIKSPCGQPPPPTFNTTIMIYPQVDGDAYTIQHLAEQDQSEPPDRRVQLPAARPRCQNLRWIYYAISTAGFWQLHVSIPDSGCSHFRRDTANRVAVVRPMTAWPQTGDNLYRLWLRLGLALPGHSWFAVCANPVGPERLPDDPSVIDPLRGAWRLR